MKILTNFTAFSKKTLKILFVFLTCIYLTQCGIYRKTDSRKIPYNAKDRVQKNMEEGRRIKFGNLGGVGGSGKFDFASSNEMWRATMDVLDFIPLNNVDYGGGVIITDWYSQNGNADESIKIMVRFLSNEIRADGLKITVYNKNCEDNNLSKCKTTQDKSQIAPELKVAILKKAAQYKNFKTEKDKKKYNKTGRTGGQKASELD